jgi:hypothetical protein
VRYSTISAIGGFSALTSATPDYLALDANRCSGGADAPLRTTIEPAPGADGALIFAPFDDAQIITLAGDLTITSDGSDAGYFAALDTLLASLKAALDALKAAPDDLVHSGGTLKVWKQAPLETSWAGITMSVTFGLVVDVFA